MEIGHSKSGNRRQMARLLHVDTYIQAIGGADMTDTHVQELAEAPVVNQQIVPAVKHGSGVKFGKNNEFQAELRMRVDDFFERTGRRRRDVPQMYCMCRRPSSSPRSWRFMSCWYSSPILGGRRCRWRFCWGFVGLRGRKAKSHEQERTEETEVFLNSPIRL
jgi:hypothetical protein